MRKISVYILKEFVSFLWYIVLAFAIIFILVDLVENVDRFIDRDIGYGLIFLYYAFYLPYIVILTLPVSMLLATMFSLGRLVGDNEITAMKASGISLYRILLPLYVFSLIVGLILMVFAESVVPRANLYREDIKRQGNEFRFTLTKNREMDRSQVYLLNDDGRIIYARGYKSRSKTAQGVFILEPLTSLADLSDMSDTIRVGLKSRIDAKFMIFSGGIWNLHDVVVRTFNDEGEVQKKYRTLPAPFIVRKPSDFARIEIDPEEMDYFQLSNYIKEVKAKGGDASGWLVDLYLKISFPFVSFVIVFFGAPMTAGSGIRGKTASFGIALIISFVYYVLINASQVLGRNGAIQPFAAAWMPNILFFLVGIFMLVRARK